MDRTAQGADWEHMTIPYGRQDIRAEDIDAVTEVLNSDHLTQGPFVPRFEQAVASKVGAKHAVAVNSATSALHIACLSLGLGKDQWLWTSPNSFVASSNCGLYCGARVDFVDIDPRSYNMCPKSLASKLELAEKEGRLPSVVVPVHFAGQSCLMEDIHALSKRYGFRIIEDASHAIGGKYQGEYIGNGRFSDIVVFSYHPVKIITTAEGGMALTNDETLAERMNCLRSHGVIRDPRNLTEHSHGPWYYEQQHLGFNYRMTDIQAALGVSQLSRLDNYVAQRGDIAAAYDNELSRMPITKPWHHVDCLSAWHLYVIRLKSKELTCSHRQVFEAMRNRGVGVNLHYIPIHLQPYYRELGFKPGDFPETERYYSETMTLPLFPTLDDKQKSEVVNSLRSVLDECR